MKTSVVKPAAPKWFVIDAEGQIIGRIAAKAAHMLRGKHLPTFSPHQLCGDHIIVLNADKVATTPAKLQGKIYYSHTGHPGGFKARTLEKMLENSPEEVIELAVKGMLPANRLRAKMLKRLHVQVGTEHKYAAQKPTSIDPSEL
jgi:large subunit ribosomal protein L13